MGEHDACMEKIKAAMKDRALYLAFLYRSFSKALPAEQAQALARQAIYEYGRLKGKMDGGKISAEDWVDRHMASGVAALFDSEVAKGEDGCEQTMEYCALLEAWKELGCSPEEMDLLCDIAMEVDRGRADYHGIPWEIPERMGKGDRRCRLVLKKNR